MVPDQNGDRGASRLVRFLSTRISLGLYRRPLGQRARVGQRRRCSRRRRGRAESLVTIPPLPGSPLAFPAWRTPWGPVPAGARRRAQPLSSRMSAPGRAEARPSLPWCGSGPSSLASACALLPVRSCILSEVSTRSRSKLPTGKNVLLLGKCPLSRRTPQGPPRPGQGPGARTHWLTVFVRTAQIDRAPPPDLSLTAGK